MGRRISLVILVLSLCFPCNGNSEIRYITEPPENESFGAGESLFFAVNYGFVNAGYALLSIDGVVELRGRLCYHIISKAWTNSAFSLFFPVRDRVESFMDVERLHSLLFEKHLREGKFKADKSFAFYQDEHIVRTKKYIMQIPPRTQDVLSSLYFARLVEFDVGDTVAIPNHTDGKNYPLAIVVHKKDTVEVPAGKFSTFMVEPILVGEGVFQQKGRMWVWLTDDTRKLPVMMKSKIVIGSIDAVLVDFTYGEPYSAER